MLVYSLQSPPVPAPLSPRPCARWEARWVEYCPRKRAAPFASARTGLADTEVSAPIETLEINCCTALTAASFEPRPHCTAASAGAPSVRLSRHPLRPR